MIILKMYIINILFHGFYIFKDDTIKTIKDKIACTIKNNPKYGENLYITPSRQYLWCEKYSYNKNPEKIMIGQNGFVVMNY